VKKIKGGGDNFTEDDLKNWAVFESPKDDTDRIVRIHIVGGDACAGWIFFVWTNREGKLYRACPYRQRKSTQDILDMLNEEFCYVFADTRRGWGDEGWEVMENAHKWRKVLCEEHEAMLHELNVRDPIPIIITDEDWD